MKFRVLMFLLGTCLTIFQTSCTHKVSRAYSVSEPDGNQRVKVSNAYFKNHLSPVGIGVTAAAMGAGAYGGTQVDFFNVNDYEGNQTVTNDIGNMVVGAAIGFGVASLVNYYVAKQGKKSLIKDKYDLYEWTKKHDRKFVPVRKDQFRSFTIIKKSSEFDFTPKALADAQDYVNAFPDGRNKEDVLKETMSHCDRNELFELRKLAEGTNVQDNIEHSIILKSTKISEVLESSDDFGDHGLNIEKLAHERVFSLNDVKTFHSRYPRSNYNAAIIDKVYPKFNQSELVQLIDLYPKNSNIVKAKKKYVRLADSPSSILRASRKYPSAFSSKEVDKMAYQSSGSLEQYVEYDRLFKSGQFRDQNKDKIIESIAAAFRNCGTEKDYYEFEEKFGRVPYSSSYIASSQKERERIAANYLKDYYRLKNIRSGYRLVKVVFESDDGAPVSQYLDGISKEMKAKESRVLWHSPINIISSVTGYGAKGDQGIIHGKWWRSGTDGGDFWRYDEQFEDFPGIMSRILSRYDCRLISCDYLGDYSDDQADYERHQEYRADQCSKCVIVDLKYVDDNNYKMIMENGNEYDCARKNGKWIVKGWIFDDTYSSLEDLSRDFLNQCKRQYCN